MKSMMIQWQIQNKRYSQIFINRDYQYLQVVYLVKDTYFRVEVVGVNKATPIIKLNLTEAESQFYLGRVEFLHKDVTFDDKNPSLFLTCKKLENEEPYKNFEEDAEVFDDMDFNASVHDLGKDEEEAQLKESLGRDQLLESKKEAKVDDGNGDDGLEMDDFVMDAEFNDGLNSQNSEDRRANENDLYDDDAGNDFEFDDDEEL